MADLLREIQRLAATHSVSGDIQKVASISTTEYLAKMELCSCYYTLLLEDNTTQSTESDISSPKKKFL